MRQIAEQFHPGNGLTREPSIAGRVGPDIHSKQNTPCVHPRLHARKNAIYGNDISTHNYFQALLTAIVER
jgi:hypothetical protein